MSNAETLERIAALETIATAARGSYGIGWLRTVAKGFAVDATAPHYSSGNQALCDYINGIADALEELDR